MKWFCKHGGIHPIRVSLIFFGERLLVAHWMIIIIHIISCLLWMRHGQHITGACCVFAFLLAVMEVNVSLTMRYFVCSEEKMMMLCGFLLTVGKGTHPESRMDGWQDMLRCSKRQRLSRFHSLKAVQYHMKRWTGSEWDIAITKYDQLSCSDPCSKIKIHKYCVCNPSQWLWKSHWVKHYAKAL